MELRFLTIGSKVTQLLILSPLLPPLQSNQQKITTNQRHHHQHRKLHVIQISNNQIQSGSTVVILSLSPSSSPPPKPQLVEMWKKTEQVLPWQRNIELKLYLFVFVYLNFQEKGHKSFPNLEKFGGVIFFYWRCRATADIQRLYERHLWHYGVTFHILCGCMVFSWNCMMSHCMVMVCLHF